MAILKSLPYSLEAVREVCSVTPTRAVDACSICSKIPENASRFEKGGVVEHDTIPAETSRLRFFMDFGPNVGVAHIAQCPECARLYECEHEYEYLVGGSEESASFRRVTAEQIVKNWLWTTIKQPGELQFDGTAWQVVIQGRRNHRTF